MLNFLNKKSKTKDDSLETLTLQIGGMHCTSCAVNIDLSLEELSGVVESNTDYTKNITKLTIKKGTNIKEVEKVIKTLGYTVTQISL